MKAPKCRLCGRRHWGNCVSHVDVVVNNPELVVNKPKLVANVVVNSRSSSTEEQRFCKPTVSGSIPESGSSLTVDDLPWRGAMLTKNVNMDIDGIPVEPFVNKIVNKPKDRKAYMKEYMRKRRAKT